LVSGILKNKQAGKNVLKKKNREADTQNNKITIKKYFSKQ
jgi:hypothetical protein